MQKLLKKYEDFVKKPLWSFNFFYYA